MQLGTRDPSCLGVPRPQHAVLPQQVARPLDMPITLQALARGIFLLSAEVTPHLTPNTAVPQGSSTGDPTIPSDWAKSEDSFARHNWGTATGICG